MPAQRDIVLVRMGEGCRSEHFERYSLFGKITPESQLHCHPAGDMPQMVNRGVAHAVVVQASERQA